MASRSFEEVFLEDFLEDTFDCVGGGSSLPLETTFESMVVVVASSDATAVSTGSEAVSCESRVRDDFDDVVFSELETSATFVSAVVAGGASSDAARLRVDDVVLPLVSFGEILVDDLARSLLDFFNEASVPDTRF